MAPRSTKAKKADTKVVENEAPKKGRGRGKVTEPEAGDTEVIEKPILVSDKKNKRGKKAADSTTEVPELDDKEQAPPAKKGRKKAEVAKEVSNGDDSEESLDKADDDENVESNGHVEEPSSGRGRKKPAKKEPAKPEPRSGRGKKAKQDSDDADAPKTEDLEKPKPRGRGKKPAEPEPSKSDDDEPLEKPAPKGRKKALAKVAPEKIDTDEEIEEDVPESKKKGKKNQAKKTPAKGEDDAASKKKKSSKKDDKAKDEDDDEVPESKPAKGKRGQKKVVETPETDEEPQDSSEPTTKRRRKADDKAPSDEKKKAPAKNKSVTDFDNIDFSNSSKNSQGKKWNFKISNWNVDGIRAWLSKGSLDFVKYEKPDILCLQEVKCSQDKLPDELAQLPGYHAYWLAGEKDGYAGVGIYTTKLAMNVTYGLENAELDNEGRVITAEYEQFYLVCTYVPNSGRKLVTLPKRLQWNEEFRKHVKELDKKKPVIICGDMNVSHKEIDLANPKTNRKNAGFTDEERAGMTELLSDGFVDSYRHLHPDKTGAYTFWTYMSNSRARNVGWRLDYFIMSERLLPSLCDNVIRNEVYGSDHCPLTLFLHLSSADKPKE